MLADTFLNLPIETVKGSRELEFAMHRKNEKEVLHEDTN
jgi:hypothetical protein